MQENPSDNGVELSQYPDDGELWLLDLESTPESRLDAVCRAYESHTGNSLPRPLDENAQLNVRKWLIDQEFSTSKATDSVYSKALLWRKHQYSAPLIHRDAGIKAGWLQQAPCVTCHPNDTSSARPISFSIRVRPFSAQALKSSSLKSIKEKIRNSMEGRFQDTGDWTDTEVCVSIVAVVGRNDRKKDVDNMAKGLLDSIQKFTFTDDNMISHLSIHRLKQTGVEGYYKILVRPVSNNMSDVVYTQVKINWLELPEITL